MVLLLSFRFFLLFLFIVWIIIIRLNFFTSFIWATFLILYGIWLIPLLPSLLSPILIHILQPRLNFLLLLPIGTSPLNVKPIWKSISFRFTFLLSHYLLVSRHTLFLSFRSIFYKISIRPTLPSLLAARGSSTLHFTYFLCLFHRILFSYHFFSELHATSAPLLQWTLESYGERSDGLSSVLASP